jgi:hypothetical protein
VPKQRYIAGFMMLPPWRPVEIGQASDLTHIRRLIEVEQLRVNVGFDELGTRLFSPTNCFIDVTVALEECAQSVSEWKAFQVMGCLPSLRGLRY